MKFIMINFYLSILLFFLLLILVQPIQCYEYNEYEGGRRFSGNVESRSYRIRRYGGGSSRSNAYGYVPSNFGNNYNYPTVTSKTSTTTAKTTISNTTITSSTTSVPPLPTMNQ